MRQNFDRTFALNVAARVIPILLLHPLHVCSGIRWGLGSMRLLLFLALIMSMFWGAAAQAQTYNGGWVYREQTRYSAEEFWLGDGNDYGLHMRGTERFCAVRGDSYAHMRSVLQGTRGSGNEFITWWIDRQCSDGYVRVCMRNSRGRQGCSTYADYGWGPRP